MRGFFDQILFMYAMSFVGTPYRWSGDDPIAGFDCSGFVLDLLSSCGVVSGNIDLTAQGIYDYLYERQTVHCVAASFGCCVFYGHSVRDISHVALALDPFRVVEAGGGGSKVQTEEDAARQNAYVRIRPVDYRNDRVAILRPNYAVIGYV